MTNTVLIKRSGTANSVPVAGNLSLGELAINYADGNLFYKNSSGAVTVIASNKFSSVTGNVTANNGMFTTIVNVASHTGAVVSVTGNVTGGNILTAGQLSATGTITSNGATSGTAFAVGNSAVSNVALGFFPNAGTSGEYAIRDYSNVATNMYFDVGMGGTANGAFQFRTSNSFRQLATINSTGITTPLAIRATGNITGNYFIGNGSQLTGISGGGGGTPGGANTQVQFNDAGSFGGNGQFVYNKVTNLLTVGSISANTNGAGTNYAVGDDGYIGDINTADTIGIKGQQNGANGYIVFGNSDATAKLGRAGTGPLTYAGAFSATGNVTGGNILTSGLISATANVTANNGMFTTIVNVASYTGAVVSVTGNITGGNVSGTALTGTLATAVQTNITSVGTLGALAVSGNVTAGNVTAGSGVSVPSGSVLFNGTTQVLTVPDNAVFEMSGDFTIEFWFYITATPVGFDTVLSKGAAGVFQPYYFTFNSSTTLLFYSSSSGSSWDVASAVSMGSVSLNAWNTAAVSRSGTAMRLFLNGALATTITNGSALYNNANAVGIGGRGDVSELFTGYVSTVRIVKGVGVYTSAYTPATAPLSSTQSANQNGNPSAAITGTSTSLLLNTANGAGFLTDSSTNNFTVTNTGTATSNSLAPFVNTSGTVTATAGVFIGNLTAAGVLTVNSGAAATAIVNGAGNAVGNIGSSGTYFNRLFAQATTALYADLAEVYKADAAYPPGTVLVFGGDQEVTVSTSSHDARIAGVVSTNPAHVMNSGLVSEYTVEVGLIGRVPCQVIGPIAAGDRVVSSSQAGVAERLDMQHYQPGVIIGKAVESYNGTGVGTIEVVVGRL